MRLPLFSSLLASPLLFSSTFAAQETAEQNSQTPVVETTCSGSCCGGVQHPALASQTFIAAGQEVAVAEVGAEAEAGELEFQPLFLPDLSNAVIHGGNGVYERTPEGEILGKTTATGGPNTFLCTEKNYSNFVLRYEFKTDSRINSGVQILSTVLREDDQGRKIIGGPQVEIDTDPKRDRQWSGGIFGEKLNWFLPFVDAQQELKDAFSAQGRRLTNIDDWNSIVVLVVDGRITTWLNGELRADLHGGGYEKEGLIGLQVHFIGNQELVGLDNRWREVEIVELDKGSEYEPVRKQVEKMLAAE